MPRIIRPKNWGEFQHYKDRSPIWIKLHKRLLDDYEFQNLPVASKALAPMLWLLASEYEGGEIPAYTRKIAFRMRMTLEDLSAAFQPLLSAGFFEIIGEEDGDASKPLAEPERVAIPEKRTSNKGQEREQLNTMPADAGGVPVPKPKAQKTDYPQEFEQFWKAYDPPKNATKPDALKSWQRSADVRPPLPELLVCVAAYRSWIAAESRKRKDPYPIKHPATWLNKRGWESFLASARSAPDPAVQDRADQLMRRGKYAVDFKDVA